MTMWRLVWEGVKRDTRNELAVPLRADVAEKWLHIKAQRPQHQPRVVALLVKRQARQHAQPHVSQHTRHRMQQSSGDAQMHNSITHCESRNAVPIVCNMQALCVHTIASMFA